MATYLFVLLTSFLSMFVLRQDKDCVELQGQVLHSPSKYAFLLGESMGRTRYLFGMMARSVLRNVWICLVPLLL